MSCLSLLALQFTVSDNGASSAAAGSAGATATGAGATATAASASASASSLSVKNGANGGVQQKGAQQQQKDGKH